jgi:hypothetical protein
MSTQKQQRASKENIKKAQKKWREMSSRQHALAQPEGKNRAKPGSVGDGAFYRVVVRDKKQFTSFRNQDVGNPGGIERLAGHRKSGSWATQAWLIEKNKAKVSGDTLIALDEDAQQVLDQLGSPPKHKEGDIFTAKPRPNVPEIDKPTLQQQRARSQNIQAAQQAR